MMEHELERQLKEIDERIRDLGSQKKRILGIGDEAITAFTAAPNLCASSRSASPHHGAGDAGAGL
jgi:hypothetical protein